jgi:hypothetical protein
MATEIKRLRPESIRTTGASANDVLVVSGGQTAFVNELFVSGLNIGTSSSIAGAKLQVVGDIEISGSIFQSGDLFSASDTGLAANLVTTGQSLLSDISTVSGLITSNDTELNALRTATGSLQTQVTANDGDISTNAGNISTNTSNISTNTSNISSNTSNISTNTSNISSFSSSISSNTSNISTNTSNISTNTSNISTNASNLVTTGQTLQSQITSNDSDISTNAGNISTNASNLVTTGQTLQTQITSNDGDITSLTSNLVTTGQTLQAQVTSNDSDISTLQTATGALSSTTVKTTTNQTIAGDKTFTDLVTINNLTVTGTETIVSTANLNVKDNIILINSGEAGAGISLVSGGLEIDRGSATNANILFNDSTDQFELNFPIATEGNLVATAPNLISTGQTLQTQITSNDGDISTLTSNLVTTGQTLQTQITSNDGDISTNAGNISTNTSNISTNTSSISTNASNLVTTGQTLQTQITSNDSDISTLTSNLTSTGSTLDAKIDTLSGIVALDSETGDHVTTSMTGGFATKTIHESFSQGLNVGTSATLGSRKLHVVGDVEISGTIFQSGSKFEGGGGGGGLFSGVGDLTSDVYTGDGITTGYDLSIAPTGVNSVLVSVGGIIQTPTTNYTITGSGLNFSSPPPTGTEIEIRNLNYAAGYVTTAVTNTLDAKIDTLSGVVALDSETGAFGNMSPTSINSNLIPDGSGTRSLGSAANPWDDLFVSSGTINIGGKTISLTESGISFNSDISIDGTIFQSGEVFEGGGGGGGSSTFVGLSDTPGSFTANKYVRVNSAGNALEYTENIGGINTTDIFTGDGSASGFAISSTVTSTKDLLVSINGILQRPDTDYTLAGTTGLFFNTGVTSGYFIEARHIVGVSGTNGADGADGAAASGWATTDQGYFTGFDLSGTATGIVQNASGSVAGLDLADNKWDVSIVEETDVDYISGDTSWTGVVLLMPFDGVDGATTWVDESDANHTSDFSYNGNVIDTAQSKWGGTSLYFDGNDYLDVTQSSYTGGDFDFDTGDFTIETWIRFTSTHINNYCNIWLPTGPSTPDAKFIRLTWDGRDPANNWYIYCKTGSDFTYQDTSLAADTWYHIAVSRTSGVIKFFKDGTQLGSDLNNANAMGFYGGMRLGKTYSTWTPAYNFGGWMDDFRVTKGVGRYTSNFTAPTEAFQTEGGVNIVETKYISQIGGWDDTDVDYGIKKISNSELSVKKMGADVTSRPIDRLYVNVQKLGAIGQGVGFNQIFTGDGTTTNYLLTDSVPNTQDLLVSVQGLIQTPNTDYSLAGNTGVSFTTGVPSGDEISLRYLALGPSGAAGATGPSGAGAGISYSQDIFTGNGVVSGFSMGRTVSNILETTVFVNGLAQISDVNYFVNGTGLTFTSGDIASGDLIMVRHIY